MRILLLVGRALSCCVCLALGGAARAADSVPSLELAELLAVARADNPAIRSAQARAGAMQQRPIQEGTLPDPMLGVRFHNETFDEITWGDSEFSFLELALEQEIPFPGKLGLREQIASREAEREGAMRDATELMVLSEVASRYHELALVDRTTEILRESDGALDRIVRQAAARYSVGTVAQQDVLRASLERGALRERITMLEQKRAAAGAALSALLGRASDDPLAGRFEFLETAPLEPLSELVKRLRERAPELRAAQEDVLRSDAALSLARRDYFPDFALMGAYMNKQGLAAEWELGIRVSVPLYFWRRQRAAVIEQRLEKRAAERAREGERLDLEARLRELHAMAETSGRLVDLYDGSLIPQAALTLESARASYEVGSVDLLSTLNAFTALLEYRIRDAEEKTSQKRARAEIAPLVGETPLGERIGGAP